MKPLLKRSVNGKNTQIKQIKSDSPTPNEMSLPQTTSSYDEDDKTDQSEYGENVAIDHEIDFTVLDVSLISSLTPKTMKQKKIKQGSQ